MSVVLSVGQCGFDDSRLSRVVGAVGATLQRASDVASAERMLAAGAYDLVLVNRVFDATGESGIEFIRRLKVDRGILTPVMLVSDYPEAQAAATEAGARPGFGKSQLSDPEVIDRLKLALA